MEGEITRQRRMVEAYFVRLEEWLASQGYTEREIRKEISRKRNVMDYLEVTFSEDRLRQYYALYLWGRGWRADYADCPAEFRAAAENCPYEDVIINLVRDWVAFKKAPAETILNDTLDNDHGK